MRTPIRNTRAWLVALLLWVLLPGAAVAREIVLLSWEDYVAPELLAQFTKATGTKVRVVTFEDDGERDKLLVAANAGDFDLICVNHTALGAYRGSGWLAPVGAAEVPNLRHVERRWFERVPEADGYGVPYFWGTTGIAYRKDLVDRELQHWKDLLDPSPALAGAIAMTTNARDLTGVALKALGYSVNSSDPVQLKEAEALLLKQRPAVRNYNYELAVEREKSALITGQTKAALAFNGDALQLQALEPRVVYVVPAEGTSLWIDFLAVAAQSTRKADAFALLDFLNQPDVAARNARHVNFASPNKAAQAVLPPAFLGNPTIYPPASVLEHAEFEQELPPRAQKRVNELVARVLRVPK